MLQLIYDRYKDLLKICQSNFANFYDGYSKYQLFLAAVLMAVGVGCFFLLPCDPPLFLLLTPILLAVFAWLGKSVFMRTLCGMLLVVAIGFSAAQIRTLFITTQFVAKPVYKYNMHGIVSLVESHKSGLRLVVRDLKNPINIRLLLRKSHVPANSIVVGSMLNAYVNIFPPSKPAHPWAYNFRRAAYFQGIGAVGYSIRQATVYNSDDDASDWSMDQLRYTIRSHFLSHLTTQSSAISLALVTGEKGLIPDTIRQAYSKTGIAHLLAISGLHMTIIAGLAFLLIRRGLCFVPVITLTYNTKKWAVIGAFFATSFYLALCWGSVSALRAYLMSSIVFLAVVWDRQAVTLRTLACAAIGILLFWPETLMTPSFQLSFAAVIGIVTFYQNKIASNTDSVVLKAMHFLKNIVLTTLRATFATMPFTMYHFQQISLHGLWVNALAIPLTSFLLMPVLTLYCFTIPFGGSTVVEFFLEHIIHMQNSLALTVADMPWCALDTKPISLLVLSLTLGAMLLLSVGGRIVRKQAYVVLGMILIYWLSAPPIIGLINTKNNTFVLKQDDTMLLNKNIDHFALKQLKTYFQTAKSVTMQCKHNKCMYDLDPVQVMWSKSRVDIKSKNSKHRDAEEYAIRGRPEQFDLLPLPCSGQRIWDRQVINISSAQSFARTPKARIKTVTKE